MQIFLINLERSTDRLEHFRRQAAAAHISFERISAVDGRTLSQEEIDRHSSVSFQFKPLNRSEFGLFVSHKNAWERLVETGDRYAAVFEDDAVLSPELGCVLRAIDEGGVKFDILKLETTFRPVVLSKDSQTLSGGYELKRLWTWHGGTAGYVISADCAQRLLSVKRKVSDPIDQVLFNPLSKVSASLELLQITPAVCVQNDFLPGNGGGRSFGSTIQQPRSKLRFSRYGVVTGFRRLLQKLGRTQHFQRLRKQCDKTVASIPFDQSHLRKTA